jgi:hypothetical protein
MGSSGRRSALLTAMALALAAPTGADAAVLHDQTQHVGLNEVYSDDDSQDVYDDQSADDFTVPPGQSWQISRADVIGEIHPYLGAGPPQAVNVFIYAQAGTLPGAELFRQAGIAATNQPNYAIPVSGAPNLGPGSYWISIQQAGADFMVPSWTWFTSDVQVGNPAVYRQPRGGFYPQCTDWKPIPTCFPGDSPDLSWKISGTASSLPITQGILQRLRNGNAELTVDVAGPGTVALSGTGIKPATAQAAARMANTSLTFLIKATGKKRKKLKSKGKVKVSPSFTYTSPGATPSTATFNVKLVKRRR